MAVADVSGGLSTEADIGNTEMGGRLATGDAAGDRLSSIDRLSTIPEGSHETENTQETVPSDDRSIVGSYLQHRDHNMQASLDKVKDLLELPLADELSKEPRDELNDRMPLSLLTANVDEVTLAEPCVDPSISYVELAVYPPHEQYS